MSDGAQGRAGGVRCQFLRHYRKVCGSASVSSPRVSKGLVVQPSIFGDYPNLSITNNMRPPGNTEAARTVKKQGNRCELKPYEGRQHGFFNVGRGDGQDSTSTRRALDEFLVSLGYLKGAPTLQ